MIGTDAYHISIDLSSSKMGDSARPAGAKSDYRVSDIVVSGFDPRNAESLQAHQKSHEPLKAQSLGNGAIRLFRDFDDGKSSSPQNSAVVDPRDDTMLSIIALPTYFTATDLLGYVGDYYMDHVTHIRILKSEKPNRFLVLLKFNDAVKAAEFQYHFDGKPFNSMEPEACHVVFVRSVSLEIKEKENDENTPSDMLIPFLMRDPFTSLNQNMGENSGSDSISKPESLVSVELPTCPVCLEKLDCEISGLLTIPCQHTFHCQCLSKWRDDTCPVCRYTNNISNHNIRRSVRRLSQINSRMHQQQLSQSIAEETSPSQVHSGHSDTCMDCPTTDYLWVCLICGNLGCSRYAPQQHSLKHFVESGHCFAMELSTSRVWDYAGDSYVHRLITSESDGKIVEFPNKNSAEEKTSSKSETEGDEYSELLLSQLISQREYYELLLKDKAPTLAGRRRSSVAVEGGVHLHRVTELEEKVEELTLKLEKVNANVIPALKQKIDMKQVSLKLAAQELRESNVLSEGLSQKVEHLAEENSNLKTQNEDLSEQVKDLMFFLESREKFKDQPAEVTDGQIIMRPSKKKSSKKKK